MTDDVFSLPVFPPADVFPMMSEEELAELAADIKANGLRDPLVVAKVGGDDDAKIDMLVDGRNRRAACKAAGVEPKTRRLNGEDPKAFVISVNAHRRHMTKGALAVAIAMIYPEPAKLKRKGSGSTETVDHGVSAQRLSYARTVLAYSRPLAEAVRDGAKSLDEAYREVQRASGNLNVAQQQLRDLRKARPDLADKVEEIGLEAALKQAADDAEVERLDRRAFTRHLVEFVHAFERDPKDATAAATKYDPLWAEGVGGTVTPDQIRRAVNFVTAVVAAMQEPEAP